jgi:hypothetical protein
VASSTSYSLGAGAQSFAVSDTRDFQVGDYVHVINTAASNVYAGGYISAMTANTSITVTVTEVWGTASSVTTWQIDRATPPTTPASTQFSGSTGGTTINHATSSYYLSINNSTGVGTTTTTNGQLQIHESGTLTLTVTLSAAPNGGGRTTTFSLYNGGTSIGSGIANNTGTTASISSVSVTAGMILNLGYVSSGTNVSSGSATWSGTFTPSSTAPNIDILG